MSRIFWDTNLFIYLFEGRGEEARRVAMLRERMRERGDHLFTSTLTLGELLVKPMEKGDDLLKERYEQALESTTQLISFDRQAAFAFASIRRDRSLKAPDAIQLACAAAAKVDLFVTNDERLRGKVIPGIHFIVALENAAI
jgi:predicted nucleic acid-binding protein